MPRLSATVPSAKEIRMNEAYREYVKEHPEELAQVIRIKRYSRMVEKDRASRRSDLLKNVRKWKEILNDSE